MTFPAPRRTSGVALPEGFYLGFEQYRGSPPDAAATPLLNAPARRDHRPRARCCIKTAHRQADRHQPRPAAAGERPGAATTAAAAPPRRRPGAKAAPAGDELIMQLPWKSRSRRCRASFRESLNNDHRDKRLYIVRALQMKNQVA